MGYLLTVLFYLFQVGIAGSAMHVVTTLAGKSFFMFPVVYTISAYTLVLAQTSGFGSWVAFFLGFLAALVFGVFSAFLERRLSKDSFAVLGIAALFASTALVKSWNALTNGVLGISGVHRPLGLESLGALVLFCFFLSGLVFLIEALCLRTRFSRQWRGMKEAKHVLVSMGISTEHLSFWTLVLACGILSLAAMPFAWFQQYIDPNSVGGLLELLRGLSIAILATRPKVSHVLASTFFVVVLPESLRFLDLPASVMGPLRSILYSLLLIVVLFVLQRRSTFSNRQI